jgi:hypothetical protein
MKKISIVLLSASFLFSQYTNAQENPTIAPYSFNHQLEKEVPIHILPSHDFTQDIIDAQVTQKQGNYPRIAKSFDVNLEMNNSGVWNTLSNGDRVWRLSLKSAGALATCLYFDNFFLPEGSTLHVYTPDHKQLFGSYTYLDNQGNDLFSTEFLKGEEEIIEYYEPLSVKGQGRLRITSLAHQYRELAMADDCEVNIICSPEGDNWQDKKKGVVRILVKEGADVGYCSGTLINNTQLDCKRYILTAFHCGVNATASDFTQWKFYFNYEATQCTGQADTYGAINNVFTGCTKKADSDDNGGDSGSDFLLLQMTSTLHPTWWHSVYFNGWNKGATAPAGGSIAIHHPAGTNKKISKTAATAISATWGGQVAGTHWRINWTGTTNGWGVTEGGSSGSPLFNPSGLVVGTLTGGGSYCNSTQAGGQNQADSYGKLAYHWISDGTVDAHQLKPWLDPINSGVTTLNGSVNPCNSVGITEISAPKEIMNIYPNPNNGSFSISINLEKREDIEIIVYNYTGQQIFRKKVELNAGDIQTIDLKDQADGVYFIQLKTTDYFETKNVIISKSK